MQVRGLSPRLRASDEKVSPELEVGGGQVRVVIIFEILYSLIRRYAGIPIFSQVKVHPIKVTAIMGHVCPFGAVEIPLFCIRHVVGRAFHFIAANVLIVHEIRGYGDVKNDLVGIFHRDDPISIPHLASFVCQGCAPLKPHPPGNPFVGRGDTRKGDKILPRTNHRIPVGGCELRVKS